MGCCPPKVCGPLERVLSWKDNASYCHVIAHSVALLISIHSSVRAVGPAKILLKDGNRMGTNERSQSVCAIGSGKHVGYQGKRKQYGDKVAPNEGNELVLIRGTKTAYTGRS